jgi:DNA-binding NtrC family response regulator
MAQTLPCPNGHADVGRSDAPAPPGPPPARAFHDAVVGFKRHLLERALVATGGNRTHAARALGMQRTYLLRLIRDLDVDAPPPRVRRRPPAASVPAPDAVRPGI